MKKIVILIIFVVLCSGAVGYFFLYPAKTHVLEKLNQQDYKSLIAKMQSHQTAVLAPNKLSAWIAWWSEDQAFESMRNQKDKINEILPVWYNLDDGGHLIEISQVKRKNDMLGFAHANNIQVVPSIANDFSPEKVSAVLDDESLQEELINELVFKGTTLGVKGWDLDWEELYPGDKQGFTDFVDILSKRLHENNLTLSVTVHAKTGTIQDFDGTKSQDWDSLGKSADYIRIMAYDFHGEDSPPGAVTPLDKYIQVLEYAILHIPMEKIIVGLPTYGYEWNKEKGTGLQYNEALANFEKYKQKFNRDEVTAALTGSYSKEGQKYEVWFEDAESTKAKIDLAKTYGINQFCFWRLGGEDGRIWEN